MKGLFNFLVKSDRGSSLVSSALTKHSLRHSSIFALTSPHRTQPPRKLMCLTLQPRDTASGQPGTTPSAPVQHQEPLPGHCPSSCPPAREPSPTSGTRAEAARDVSTGVRAALWWDKGPTTTVVWDKNKRKTAKVWLWCHFLFPGGPTSKQDWGPSRVTRQRTLRLECRHPCLS